MTIERHPAKKKSRHSGSGEGARKRRRQSGSGEESGAEQSGDEVNESGGEEDGVVHATKRGHLSRNFSGYLYPYMLIKEGLPTAVVAAGNSERSKMIEAIERTHNQFLIASRPWAWWSTEEQKKQQALFRNSHSQHLRFGKNEVKAAVMDICCKKREDAKDPYLGYAQVMLRARAPRA